jgi:outer membrane autotransporter protein
VGATRSWHDIETKRAIRFPGFGSTAKSKQNGHTDQFFGELGYAVVSTAATEIVPFAGYARLSTKVDGTLERGGPASLEVERVSRSVGLGQLGVRFNTEVTMATGGLLKPRATVAWQHAMGDRRARANSSFAGSDAFTVNGAAVDRHSVVFDGGVEVEVGSFTVGGGLNGSIGANSESYGGNARLSLRF